MHIVRPKGYQRPPRFRWRRRLRFRHVFALVIAGLSLYGYFSSVEANPVTGEEQFVALTVPEEIEAGLNATPILSHSMGGIVPLADPQAALVDSVGKRLCAANGTRHAVYKFEFHLLDDRKTINAFALPGGQIFITRGLLNELEHESELAAVLGHEMGHVIHRHCSEKMALRMLGCRLSLAAGIGTNSKKVAVGSLVTNTLTQLHYSREDERESDDWGLRYAIQAGYDPRGMQTLFELLALMSKGARLPDIVSTHPNPEERKWRAAHYIQEQFPQGVPASLGTGRELKAPAEIPALPVERPTKDTTGF